MRALASVVAVSMFTLACGQAGPAESSFGRSEEAPGVVRQAVDVDTETLIETFRGSGVAIVTEAVNPEAGVAAAQAEVEKAELQAAYQADYARRSEQLYREDASYYEIVEKDEALARASVHAVELAKHNLAFWQATKARAESAAEAAIAEAAYHAAAAQLDAATALVALDDEAVKAEQALVDLDVRLGNVVAGDDLRTQILARDKAVIDRTRDAQLQAIYAKLAVDAKAAWQAVGAG
jgi:hypothetical protein